MVAQNPSHLDLYNRYRAIITQISHWTTKEATRNQTEIFIRDFLWDEQRGLPDPGYALEEIP